MVKYNSSLLILSLFWQPACPANPGTARTAIRRVASVSVIAGASYFGLTQDGRKTRTTVWDAAGKVIEKVSETTDETKEWFSGKLNQNREWLSEKFGEQKDEHATILKTLTKLDKQNDLLEKQNKVLKRQNALILSKVYDLEAIIAQVNQNMYNHQAPTDKALTQKTDFLTVDNEANEHLLTRRGIIVMESDQE
jgi:hypothetical protein